MLNNLLFYHVILKKLYIILSCLEDSIAQLPYPPQLLALTFFPLSGEVNMAEHSK